MRRRFPLTPLHNSLSTPESQWQPRGKTAYLTGVSTGNACGRIELLQRLQGAVGTGVGGGATASELPAQWASMRPDQSVAVHSLSEATHPDEWSHVVSERYSGSPP